MKYRYTALKRTPVVVFSLLSLFVVLFNIIGLSRLEYVPFYNAYIVVFTLIGSLLSFLYLGLGFKKFNLDAHRKFANKFRRRDLAEYPTVDVFMPSAGEPIKLLRRTYRAVSKIRWPQGKLNVYVLDDKGSDQVKALAKEFGYHYKSRLNKGEFKKAGNLKHGYENSNGEHILILDADFAPRPEILYETIPYLEHDPSIGIVQTPQEFIVNRSEPSYIQKGDIAIQEYFYRVCQPGRNKFDASICTGTNAIYRRKALEKSGGFYQIEHSEDSHTGLNLRKNGFSMLYLPLVLAKGYCPSDYKQLYKQRSRWCQGSLTMMVSPLFWSTSHSFMSLVSYFSGFFYYMASFLFVTVPFYTLWLFSQPHGASILDEIFFLPNVIYLLISFTTFYYPRFSFSVLGNQLFFYWTYAFTIVKSMIFRRNEPWVPTGLKQSRNQSYSQLVSLIVGTTIIYWGVFVYVLAQRITNLTSADIIILFWMAYNLTSQISLLIGLWVPSEARRRLRQHTKKRSLVVALNRSSA